MRDFLLEIGAENIPASYIEPAFKQLCDDLEEMLIEQRLAYDEIYATGTPRRLVVIVRDLAPRQEEAEEIVTGPPKAKGFDEAGNPTAAAAGFAKSHGLVASDLGVFTTKKGEFLGFRRRLENEASVDILSRRLPSLIGGLRFPKVMKWESSGAKFARPVRWIVCLYGRETVRFAFAGIESGNVSFGRPWMRAEHVVIRDAATYLRDVSRLKIVVDDDERRRRIESLAKKSADKYGLVLVDDEALLRELTFMTEDPRPLTGEFSPEYLRLPPDVVTTAMRSHQRYIALTDARGKLVPRFITFTDGKVLAPAEVRRGNEKVLRARLEDAMFYWNEDLKRGVDGLAAELDRIVFIEGLGTLGQKSRRIKALAEAINGELDQSRRQREEWIARAAALAKADLASEMIKDGKEFTLLQGRIGGFYSQECGEDPAVSTAVVEHYMPRTPAEALPSSTLGIVIGLADRIDTICGCFLAGFVPSGSQDPYGLRRAANGMVRILEHETSLDIDRLIGRSVALYADGGFTTAERADAAAKQLESFFVGRCEAFLKERGIAYDVVAAVSRVSWTRPGVALARGREIARLRGDALFERLITGVKRVGNILSPDIRTFGAGWERLEAAFGATGTLREGISYETAKFTDPAEENLFEAVAGAIPQIAAFEASGGFADILATLSRLADPIDAYFDRVLVNCEDEITRENRHNFLASVYAVFARYADFLCIVEEGDL